MTIADGAEWARCSRAARAASTRVWGEPSDSPPGSRTTTWSSLFSGWGAGVGAGVGSGAGVSWAAGGAGAGSRRAGGAGEAQPARLTRSRVVTRERERRSGAAVAVFESDDIFK